MLTTCLACDKLKRSLFRKSDLISPAAGIWLVLIIEGVIVSLCILSVLSLDLVTELLDVEDRWIISAFGGRIVFSSLIDSEGRA